MPKKRLMCPSCQSAAINLIDFTPKSATDSALSRAPQEERFATVTDVSNSRIHLVLGDIDTDDNQIILCHHPAPFLARSGLEAHATVRVEEDTGSVPRSPSGSRAFEHERAQIQRRAVGENRPFAHSTKFCGHKRAK